MTMTMMMMMMIASSNHQIHANVGGRGTVTLGYDTANAW